MVIPVTQAVPTLEQAKDEVQRNDWTRAYNYMGLTAGQALADIQLDRVLLVHVPTLALKIFVPRLKWLKRQKSGKYRLNKPWWFQGLVLVKAQAKLKA